MKENICKDSANVTRVENICENVMRASTYIMYVYFQIILFDNEIFMKFAISLHLTHFV